MQHVVADGVEYALRDLGSGAIVEIDGFAGQRQRREMRARLVEREGAAVLKGRGHRLLQDFEKPFGGVNA